MRDKRINRINLLVFLTGKFLAMAAILWFTVLQTALCYFAGLVSFSPAASGAMAAQPHGTQPVIPKGKSRPAVIALPGNL